MNRHDKKQLTALIMAGFWILFTGNFQQALAGDKKAGDVSRGATAWVENCGRCHDFRDPKELRDDQWITTTTHMRVRAGLTGQQVRDIIVYLQTTN